jgi:hypothetical protein
MPNVSNEQLSGHSRYMGFKGHKLKVKKINSEIKCKMRIS